METITQDLQKYRFRANLAVLASMAAIFFPGTLAFGFPGLMGPIWREMLGVDAAALSYIMFFMVASLGIFMFFVGKLTEVLGVRNLILIGSVIYGVTTTWLAFSQSLWVVYFWAFSAGAGSCFIYSTGLNSVQRWHPKRKGLASGLVNLTFGLSAAIMVPVYRLALDAVGYQTLCLAIAALTVLVGFLAAGFAELPSRVKNIRIPDSEQSVVTQQSFPVITLDSKAAVKTKNFWMIWLVWALMGASGISMVTLSVNYGISRGYTLSMAALVLTAFNITNGFSRVISGAVSDLIGRQVTLAISFAAAAVAYFLLPMTESIVIIIILASAIGYGYGTLFSTSAPLLSDCFGIKHFGVILGLVFTAYGFIASVIGPVFVGILLSVTDNNYPVVFYYLGSFALISMILILLVKTPKPEA